MFNRSLQHRSSNQNSFLHTQRVCIQDWLNSFWIAVTCSVLRFISNDKQCDEYTWKRMSLPSRYLYKCKQVGFCNLCILFTLSLQCYCCLFTCLPLFFYYTDVVAIFLFIRWSCNQAHCFVFEAFVYHFNNTISIFVAISAITYKPLWALRPPVSITS